MVQKKDRDPRDPKEARDTEVTFEIVDHIGVLSTSTSGWKKELNLVKWNEGNAKFDLRDWDEEHRKMSRGITMNQEEVRNLQQLLATI